MTDLSMKVTAFAVLHFLVRLMSQCENSLLTYSLASHQVVFPLLEKGPNSVTIGQHFNTLPAPGGGTAFFDALGAAFSIYSGFIHSN